MTALDEFQKRKVAPWALAYGTAAWLILQVLGLVAVTYEWPPLVMRLAVGAVAVGFPVVVVLAWYHGERGEQHITRGEVLLLALLLLIGGRLLWKTANQAQAQHDSAAHAVPAAPATIPEIGTDPSIAVLPFVDMSKDKDQEYFSDGISEELLNLLTRVHGLRVVARTSSFSFRGREVEIADIARRLNVAAVLEGSVRKSGDTMRITAKLVRAVDSTQLWSQSYDRNLDDVFTVQDEIAAAVVEQLRLKLLGAAATATQANPQAFALYLQARYLQRQFTPGALEESLRLYKEALAIEPRYAPALAGLAEVCVSQVEKGLRPVADGLAAARDAAGQALSIDPNLVAAHIQLASITMDDGDLREAARYTQRALELEPESTRTMHAAARLLSLLGRVDQAMSLERSVAARDPIMPNAHFNLGASYYFARRPDEAIASIRAALALSPELVSANYLLGSALLQQGQHDAALEATLREPAEPWRLLGLVMVYHAMGRSAESDKALADMIAGYGQEWPYNIAYVLAFRDDRDRAFDWLDQAVQRKDVGINEIPANPLFANLSSDARWLPFLRSIGKAPEQLAAIDLSIALPR
jgi:TolB-like protein